jgi:hypothetical protein
MDEALNKNLITELGLDKLPPEAQAEALTRMGVVIYQAVILRVIDSLSEEEAKVLEKMMTEHPEDGEAVYEFLREKVPGLEEIFADEVALYKKETLEIMGSIH